MIQVRFWKAEDEQLMLEVAEEHLYNPKIPKLWFDLTNPLGHYVHGLKITSYVINMTIYENANIFHHAELEIDDLSIENLTSLSLYKYFSEPDTIQDEEGPIPFNYTEYGKPYPRKLVIH